MGLVAVGVCSLGVEESEVSSWLDRNPNQVGFGGFLQEMLVNYYSDSRDMKKLDLLLWLVWVGPSIASEKISVVQVLTVVGSEVQGPEDNQVKGSEKSVHLEVGRQLKEVRRFQGSEVRYIPRRSNLGY